MMRIKKLFYPLLILWHLTFDSSGSMPIRPNPFRPSENNYSRGFFNAQNIRSLKPKNASNLLPEELSINIDISTENENFIWKEHIEAIDKLNNDPEIKKVDCATITRIFRENTQKYYASFTMNGYNIFYNPNMFNLNNKYKINEKPKTNLEIMQNGFNPYNIDGIKMSYHHLIKADPGPLVLMSTSFHQRYYRQLHPKGWGESVVNRQAFKKAKKKINKKLAKILSSTQKPDPEPKNMEKT